MSEPRYRVTLVAVLDGLYVTERLEKQFPFSRPWLGGEITVTPRIALVPLPRSKTTEVQLEYDGLPTLEHVEDEFFAKMRQALNSIADSTRALGPLNEIPSVWRELFE